MSSRFDALTTQAVYVLYFTSAQGQILTAQEVTDQVNETFPDSNATLVEIQNVLDQGNRHGRFRCCGFAPTTCGTETPADPKYCIDPLMLQRRPSNKKYVLPGVKLQVCTHGNYFGATFATVSDDGFISAL